MANKKTIDEFVEDITADVVNTKNAEENKHSAKYTRTEMKRKSLVSKYREEPKFTVRLSKIKNNRVLDRVQMVVDVFYEPNVKVTKENIKKKISSQFKKNHVVIF